MKLSIDFSELTAIGKKILPEGVSFSLDNSDLAFDPITMSLVGGIEVSIEELDSSSTLISYQGRQVLLYIRDHSYKYDKVILDAKEGNKYHISWCRKLDEMRKTNNFNRYHATNRLDGMFEIDDGKGRHHEVALQVCKLCIEKLNYKGSIDNKNKHKVFNEFTLAEFFSHYSTCFNHIPQNIKNLKNSGYTSDWKDISRATRENENYTCKQCSVNMRSAKKLCDVHHVNRIKYDNSPENLYVLCRDCHRKQPYHNHIFISHTDMNTIQILRKQQTVLKEKTWSNIYSILDFSLHGDAKMMQYSKKTPPELNYRLKDNDAYITLDAAWPDLNIALNVKPLKAPGWNIFSVGELISYIQAGWKI